MPIQRLFKTVAAANGIATDKAFGAVTPPLYLSSNFAFATFEQGQDYEYSRVANPTRDILADTLAKLEDGVGAVVTSSGMSALHLLLSRVGPGGLVIAPHDCYGGTHRLLAALKERGQIDVEFVDQGDSAALNAAFGKEPQLVLVETPSNPLMRVVDISAIVERARQGKAKVAVDNTFLSPALQQPLRLGADYVVHSTTKYLNGHSDVVGGAVIAADPAEAEALAAWANTTGVTASPFDSYLTLRGVRTLFARVERQQTSALAIARFLEQHPRIAAVHYPGLPSHPTHDIAARQQSGWGAMLSFELKDGLHGVRSFVAALDVFTLAESLGGVESLIAHPTTMTHAGMGPEARRIAGITDGLLRMSVGLEAEEDLIADLSQSLSAIG
ncbi:cystathionine gamma-synthase [Rhizobium sp. SYY.PMSO]|uniref:cystathionine gamma-synthase n=1 Tax=Rhizobium sp. SYY.PMSO TaxID=3382192 RepID=UPI0039902A4E